MTDRSKGLLRAEGWIDLGLYGDAADALNNLPAASKSTVDFRKLWVRIYAGTKEWSNVESMCKTLSKVAPADTFTIRHEAEAKHQQGRSDQAFLLLKGGLENFTGEEKADYFYALARYACALNSLTLASCTLEQAFDINPGLKSKALKDRDLEKVWSEIQV